MAIRRTYYTSADAFSSVVTADQAREWLQAAGYNRARVQDSRGGWTAPPRLRQLDEEQLTQWVATFATHQIRSRARAGKSISVQRDGGEWVSILAERVDAVGAKVVADEEAQPWSRWLEELVEPVH